ncbi:(R)-stereoselective amidase [Pelotomaculum schinkii]|uniref:(R)-stereoselective amidase n=1 Tax=Pelotomaculum schinkii TaxID=78350 RepID=A0A4Y7RHN0_9FIRM|nr:carbon-nitrogen hydrolase family protein [Pelotomaculum schinkii]TEB07817.1 (R)-stereoselective amidase [Pelotomaculum schinkii]
MHKEDEQGKCGEEVKVALVHAAIHWKDKKKNLAKLLTLNEMAAGAGARIILNTELATAGYAFESRDDIAPLMETIPGPTTRAFGRIAKKYECYICIGLPEVAPGTGIFYNAAALIGPKGRVLGRHRKVAPAFRENLWAARGNLPILVAQTEFGKLGVMICADAYSYKPARVAALEGARLLLVPANWPPDHQNPEKFWRARAAENGIYVLACNRTGKDKSMDCRSAESFIIDTGGGAVRQFSSMDDSIVYGTLPLENGKFISSAAEDILGRRRPHCYADISLDTFSHFNPSFLLGLPEPADFTVATLQFRPVSREPSANTEKMLKLIDEAAAMAAAEGFTLNLIILPELSATGIIFERREAAKWCEEIPGPATKAFTRKAEEKKIFIVLGMAERHAGKFYNSCVLIGPNGVEGKYRKIHLSTYDQKWAEAGEGAAPAFDLPFGRVGMLAGCDLMFPESADALAKLGTDLLCVPALWGDCESKFIWEARLGEQMHLAVANQWGDFGKFHALGGSLICSYSRYPEKRLKLESPAEGDKVNIMRLSGKEARDKRFVENIDYEVLLQYMRSLP